jgi:membrane-bound lytic murein transglycosylase B
MPSSIERFAVDFDGDGRVDLAANGADAIGSIANFLARHGWQRALPATFEVAPPEAIEDLALLLAPDIEPSFDAAQFARHGAQLEPAALGFGGKLALVRLENGGDPPSYVAGTANFHALTRYNRSSSYAMAVLELGRAVERTRAVAAAPAPSPAAAAPAGVAASAAAATPVR